MAKLGKIFREELHIHRTKNIDVILYNSRARRAFPIAAYCRSPSRSRTMARPVRVYLRTCANNLIAMGKSSCTFFLRRRAACIVRRPRAVYYTYAEGADSYIYKAAGGLSFSDGFRNCCRRWLGKSRAG